MPEFTTDEIGIDRLKSIVETGNVPELQRMLDTIRAGTNIDPMEWIVASSQCSARVAGELGMMNGGMSVNEWKARSETLTRDIVAHLIRPYGGKVSAYDMMMLIGSLSLSLSYFAAHLRGLRAMVEDAENFR